MPANDGVRVDGPMEGHRAECSHDTAVQLDDSPQQLAVHERARGRDGSVVTHASFLSSSPGHAVSKALRHSGVSFGPHLAAHWV
jgi:hypothetical protein